MVIDGPLRKTKHYVIRVEFQIGGSAHIHLFLLVVNALTLTKDNKEEYTALVVNVIHVALPHEAEQPELYKLITTYQLHRHSKICHKYKNESCRFKFWRFFPKWTIVAEPLPLNMPENGKPIILENQEQLLSKVKNYVKSYLNPAKINFFDCKNNFVEVKSISKVWNELGIDEFEYKKSLGISDDNIFCLHLKRPTNSCFVNKYFDIGLLA